MAVATMWSGQSSSDMAGCRLGPRDGAHGPCALCRLQRVERVLRAAQTADLGRRGQRHGQRGRGRQDAGLVPAPRQHRRLAGRPGRGLPPRGPDRASVRVHHWEADEGPEGRGPVGTCAQAHLRPAQEAACHAVPVQHRPRRSRSRGPGCRLPGKRFRSREMSAVRSVLGMSRLSSRWLCHVTWSHEDAGLVRGINRVPDARGCRLSADALTASAGPGKAEAGSVRGSGFQPGAAPHLLGPQPPAPAEGSRGDWGAPTPHIQPQRPHAAAQDE